MWLTGRSQAIRVWGAACAVLALALLFCLARPDSAAAQRSQPLPDPDPPAVAQVLGSGVLIVISKASQRMYVFKDGSPWQSVPVSTGRRGHSTPSGTFAILQKAVHHRSNIYSDAPMPYMQRLTWGGIAIHAGHLPGYPASHGCIRIPMAAARALFGLTQAPSTTVVITGEPLASHSAARSLALGLPDTRSSVPGTPATPQLAMADTTQMVMARARRSIPANRLPLYVPPRAGPTQTIQLAAALSPEEAEARWSSLVDRHPELAGYDKTVVQAVVGSRRYYRLRASAPDAHALCQTLKAAGQDCFNVS